VGQSRIGGSAYRRWGRAYRRLRVWPFGKDTKPLVKMGVAREQEEYNTFINNVMGSVENWPSIKELCRW
jgi:hypothetical protein